MNLLSRYIAFPGLDLEFTVNDTLAEFEIFGMDVTIKWYGVLIALGFLLAVLYGWFRAKSFGVDPDKMIDVAILTTVVAFVGARLYYVFFSDNLSEYLAEPARIFYVWEGGLGIYGGIIFAFVFGILFCRLFRVDVLAMFDLAALGFPIGQAIGRWGNFFNQEAFGGNTDLPWGMTGDVIAAGINGSGYDPELPVHPTFLYESLWCILGFVLLHIWSKKGYRFKGQIFCGYVVWYGFGRFLIEGLRTDSLMLGTIRISQLVAIAAILLGVVMFLVLRRRKDALPKTLVTEPDEAAPEEEEGEDHGTAN